MQAVYSRRQFNQTVLAGVSTSFLRARQKPIRLGTITYSFRDVAYAAGRPLEDGIIAKCRDAGIGLIELMCNHVEPVSDYIAGVLADPGSGNNGLRRGVFARSPEGQKARDDLREWRLATPASHFLALRQKFRDAGIAIHAYTVNGLDSDFTTDEIDQMFDQAKALGANVISSSANLSVAEKLVPFVNKHQFPVAFHNGANTANPTQVGSLASMRQVLSMSPLFRLTFDVGHFVQASLDPLPALVELHDRIAHLHIADGRTNNQPEVPFGTGDTPLRQIVTLMRERNYDFPAMVELEYPVPAGSSSSEEVRKCVEYLKPVAG